MVYFFSCLAGAAACYGCNMFLVYTDRSYLFMKAWSRPGQARMGRASRAESKGGGWMPYCTVRAR